MKWLYGISLLLLFAVAHAQQYGWRVVARPNTTGLYCVDFVDTLHGWCAGRDTIYRTTDGGVTWRGSSRRFGANSWHSVSFSDTLHGWAVGRFGSDDGLLWKTIDGGVNWTEEQLIFNRYYWSNYSHSPSRNTTSGYIDRLLDTALVVRTTNGGTSWQEQRFDSIPQLRKVLFVDSLHGWITGQTARPPGILLRTNDGGQSWTRYSTPRTGFHGGFVFLDTIRGYANDYVTFWQTTNGGAVWDSLTSVVQLSDPYFEDIAFTDTLNGWAFGSEVYQGISTECIYRTTNGGYNWYRESVGLTDDLGGLTDGEMLDIHHGWAVAAEGTVLAYGPVTSVPQKLSDIPRRFHLRSNYPNPFNPQTTIEYELPRKTNVKLTIYDNRGRVVHQLVEGVQDAGVYRVQFNAADIASGTYFYRLRTTEYEEAKPMIFLK